MDNLENNRIRLIGTPVSDPVYSHSARGVHFHLFPLRVQRLSGTADILPVLIRAEQLPLLTGRDGRRLELLGQIRSFNNRREEGPRLVITVLAREIFYTEEEDDNQAMLRGTLCKSPNLRCTPMGRDICDLMLAVNRSYGRSDYLPCICWGQNARSLASCPVGQSLTLEGRLQSRNYRKLTENGPEERTAYEVSVSRALGEE